MGRLLFRGAIVPPPAPRPRPLPGAEHNRTATPAPPIVRRAAWTGRRSAITVLGLRPAPGGVVGAGTGMVAGPSRRRRARRGCARGMPWTGRRVSVARIVPLRGGPRDGHRLAWRRSVRRGRRRRLGGRAEDAAGAEARPGHREEARHVDGHLGNEHGDRHLDRRGLLKRAAGLGLAIPVGGFVAAHAARAQDDRPRRRPAPRSAPAGSSRAPAPAPRSRSRRRPSPRWTRSWPRSNPAPSR